MTTSHNDSLLQAIGQLGMVRPKDVEALGFRRSQLLRLQRAGLVERPARGVYVTSQHAFSAEHSLALVAKRVPGGVVCLLSALRFHGLTTQSPTEVWLALPEKARRPRLDFPRLHIVHFSGEAFSEGIEPHVVEGVNLQVYSPAKTVTDCFKYRNKIGIDVAVEALRDFGERYRGGATELARFARICRVTRVMQPYMDATA